MNDCRQQQQDELEQKAIQALLDVAAHGLTEQADTLAYVSGLYPIWKQHVRATNARAVAVVA